MKKIIYRAVLSWMVITGIAAAGEKNHGKDASQVNVVKKSEFTGQMSYALGYDVFTHVRGQVNISSPAIP